MKNPRRTLALAMTLFCALLALSMIVPSIAEARPPRPGARTRITQRRTPTPKAPLRATATPRSLAHATATPTKTPVPVFRTPTSTPVVGKGVCGESMAYWHPPVTAGGCQTHHEHGDEPPAWIKSAGYDVSFVGVFNTSPKEDADFNDKGKHTSMKGVLFPPIMVNGSPMDIYLRGHFSGMPFERAGEVHSIEVFIRYKGDVSHLQGWVVAGGHQYGVGRCGGPNDFDCFAGLLNGQAKIVLPKLNGFGGLSEQWYIRNPLNPKNGTTDALMMQYGIDWRMEDEGVVFHDEEFDPNTNLFDMSRWQTVPGNVGVRRAMVFRWFLRPGGYDPREGNPSGRVWTTQFFQVSGYTNGQFHYITGPTDPLCNATTSADNLLKTYQNFCLQQYISPQLPTSIDSEAAMGDEYKKNYAAPGITLPN